MKHLLGENKEEKLRNDDGRRVKGKVGNGVGRVAMEVSCHLLPLLLRYVFVLP